MPESPTDGAFRELVDLGLIAARPLAEPLSGGNADRRNQPGRTSWRAHLPDGRPVRLIIGLHLAELAKKQTAFAQACPELVQAPLFHRQLTQGEAMAELFIDGATLESAARESPARVQMAFVRTCATLEKIICSSTEAERLAEWLGWTDHIESLAIWTLHERTLLRDCVWPKLYPLLSTTPPVIRWSNGDFTSDNILLDQVGNPHLIDHEFAHATHFFQEDIVRFHSLSRYAREQPELFSSHPSLGLGWQLFFWLRQLGLEAVHNTAAYLGRMRSIRLGEIRRLCEVILDCQLTDWSVDATPLHHTIEFARWEQTESTALRIAGWCYVPDRVLRHIQVSQGDHLLVHNAPILRPDVQTHFAGAIAAGYTGFSIAIPLHGTETPLILAAVTQDGAVLPFHSFHANHLPGRGPRVEDYAHWASLYDPDPIAPSQGEPADGPLFSVLVPVYNTPLSLLQACLASIQNQHYGRWELCVVDDGSSDVAIPNCLKQFARADPRFRIKNLPATGGIARASNAALAQAKGDFVVMVDHDDILRPHALLELASYLAAHPQTDALYSDEDKLSPEGRRIAPSFKPDFSPEYLLGVMYAGHVLCVRTSVARTVGGFDPMYDGIQDYDFFLRVTEHTNHIGHVPRILYHWRQSPGSSSLHGNIKGNIDEKQAAAVRAHLQRRGRTEQVRSCSHHRLQLYSTGEPSVEVVQATANVDPMAVLNRAAHSSNADVLIFITLQSFKANERWRQDLATLAQRPDSGLVGPLLLSPEGLVQESGWTTGLAGTAPIMCGFDPAGDGSMGSLLCTREVAAVSPVCFAIKRSLLLTYSPADENWLSYCLRLRTNRLFHRVCSTVHMQLCHNQALPVLDRIGIPPPARDPFFNPHYDPRRADYSLARPPCIWTRSSVT